MEQYSQLDAVYIGALIEVFAVIEDFYSMIGIFSLWF